MKKYNHGLILGKFCPPHLGHFFLINSSAEKCEKLTVLVCSLHHEPIDGNLRYSWMKEHYKDSSNIEIVHVVDTAREYPVDDSDEKFWDVWTGIIMRQMFDKKFDVIFTSENYGMEISKRMNFKYPHLKMDYYDVDKNRMTVPISGTDIREKTFESWDFIPNLVKPYFMKKVIFMGPESCGKSYMAKKVAEYIGNEHVEEYGRTYTDYLTENNLTIELKDFVMIAIGHSNIIRTVANNNIKNSPNRDKVLILDTDFITTKLWSEIYMRNVSPELDKFETDYMQRGDIYLLMKPDIPWINDGTREFPHLRNWHFERIEQELKKRNLPYYIIGGDYEERYQNVMSTVTKMIDYWTNNIDYVIRPNNISPMQRT